MKMITILLALTLVSTGCANQNFDMDNLNLDKVVATAGKVYQGPAHITEAQEILMGEGIASNLLGAAPLLNNKPVQQYVNQVGRWLSVQTERPDLPWHFAVLEDEDVNAFAAPGGYIFITKGLLIRMKSEAELAGVLAHEIAHVLKRHHVEAIRKSTRTTLITDLAKESLQESGVGPALTNLIGVGTELYARGLDKKDEYEADRMGVVIAARAGYDPYGLPAVLLTLQGMNPAHSGLALMFKTHPALSDRLDLLDRTMSGALDRFEAQPDLSLRFTSVMNNAGSGN